MELRTNQTENGIQILLLFLCLCNKFSCAYFIIPSTDSQSKRPKNGEPSAIAAAKKKNIDQVTSQSDTAKTRRSSDRLNSRNDSNNVQNVIPVGNATFRRIFFDESDSRTEALLSQSGNKNFYGK